MDQHHFTQDQLEGALDRYRSAPVDAREGSEEHTTRDELISAARVILDEDDFEAHQLVQALAGGEFGDPVWNLEEEVLDED